MRVLEVTRVLEMHGFERIRQKGSHRRFKGVVNGRLKLVTVPGKDGEDIPKGTLASIRRQSGLPSDVFR